MTAFAQGQKHGTTTLSEILRVRDALSPNEFFGCYAYATQSGFRAFELSVGDGFWDGTSSRWLLGIDYGRTDPRALRELAKRANSSVRIHDGAWVVKQVGFFPRQDYHPKAAFMSNNTTGLSGMVLGSGNFSYNGMLKSVEAGYTQMSKRKEAGVLILPTRKILNAIWKRATPLSEVIDDYEDRKRKLLATLDSNRSLIPVKTAKIFWVEAGYVTKNRGENKPGNQIFFPPGYRKYFGLSSSVTTKGALIGQVAIRTLVGASLITNLRVNRNGMEKMSLPTPEDHGFGVYDGKILIFERRGKSYFMEAIEAAEFELIYGHRVVDVHRMNGGRRYGALL